MNKQHAATAASRRHNRAQRNRRAFPGQLFYSTQIPVCLWFIGKNGNAAAKHAAFKTAQTQSNAAMAKAHSNFQLT